MWLSRWPNNKSSLPYKEKSLNLCTKRQFYYKPNHTNTEFTAPDAVA